MPKLAILAGGGSAPAKLAAACRATERPYHLVCLKGHAEADLGQGHPHTLLSLGELGKFRDLCRAEGIQEIVMIGHVRRPSLSELRPDWLTMKILAKIGLNALGDDAVLRAVGKVLEEECQVRLIGASAILGDLLTPEGALTKHMPNEQASSDIERAVEVALSLGEMDVGQAVIVQEGIVLGVEAVEGTDALIARSADVRREGAGGVLVKLAKPQQDSRLDLPTIGPDTVQNAHQAGLAGIALEAGRSQIVDREMTIEIADRLGLFIVGLSLQGKDKTYG
ncbi:MAG: LpxI family protein [Proteobacteria bacterium]|nr:LpxI family protein [Pseudomonadota bacterium]